MTPNRSQIVSHLSAAPEPRPTPAGSLVPIAVPRPWPTTHVASSHPAAGPVTPGRPQLTLVPDLSGDPEDGSLVAEYGLLAVVAATVAGVLISWAGSGALASFFGQLLNHARSLVIS